MQFTPTQTMTPSILTHGWHPAYLLKIVEEPAPAGFNKPLPGEEQRREITTVWRWYYAVWQTPTDVPHAAPEEQNVISTTNFSAGGKFGPSKAYTWVSDLLGRPLEKGENPTLPEPYACRVKVERAPGKDYVRLVGFETWPGAPTVPPASIQALLRHGAVQTATGNGATAQSNVPVAQSEDDDIPY